MCALRSHVVDRLRLSVVSSLAVISDEIGIVRFISKIPAVRIVLQVALFLQETMVAKLPDQAALKKWLGSEEVNVLLKPARAVTHGTLFHSPVSLDSINVREGEPRG